MREKRKRTRNERRQRMRKREKKKGRVIYVFISWRARVRRDSHPRRMDVASMVDGGPVRRGHLPAHGPVILPSLSFSPSLHLFLTPSLPSTAISPLPLHGSRNGGGGGTVHGAPLAPTPFQPSAPLYNILALCFSAWWSSRMITRYEFLSARRESRGTSPRLEHVTLAERVFGWTRWIRLEDSNGWLRRGEGSGQVSREEICLDGCLAIRIGLRER